MRRALSGADSQLELCGVLLGRAARPDARRQDGGRGAASGARAARGRGRGQLSRRAVRRRRRRAHRETHRRLVGCTKERERERYLDARRRLERRGFRREERALFARAAQAGFEGGELCSWDLAPNRKASVDLSLRFARARARARSLSGLVAQLCGRGRRAFLFLSLVVVVFATRDAQANNSKKRGSVSWRGKAATQRPWPVFGFGKMSRSRQEESVVARLVESGRYIRGRGMENR